MTATTTKVIPTELAQQIADQVATLGVTPLREARVFHLLTTAGYANDEIANMVGRRVPYVGWRLDLLKLTPAGLAALDAGRLPVNLAWYIAQLTEPNQNLMLARWAREEFSGARHAERYAQAIHRDENSGLLA